MLYHDEFEKSKFNLIGWEYETRLKNALQKRHRKNISLKGTHGKFKDNLRRTEYDRSVEFNYGLMRTTFKTLVMEQ
jgi:hypothetical protein